MNIDIHSPVAIDGSQGEAGGQVLRSSLTLSALTGRPFRIEHIRAKRKKPGLMRQHLTAVKAAATICRAETSGPGIGASTLSFTPGTVSAGNYHFAVGTAGSTMLILQTILLPLCLADGPSEIILEGGTHNLFAPPFDFVEDTFLNCLRRMGVDVTMTLERPGFFPAGGGRLVVHINPCEALWPIDLSERGEAVSQQAIAMQLGLPGEVADRELKIVQRRLGLCTAETVHKFTKEARGVGNVLLIKLGYGHITEVFTAFGERGVAAEKVAHKACDAAERYLRSDAPVGEYLADQLLLPMAIAGGGTFRCLALTDHFTTNAAVIQQFLDIQIETHRDDRLDWRVSVHP